MYGSVEPDRYVLIGNHRDSWVYGAVDASTGTSVTTEIARGLGELKKAGWKPRRTIKVHERIQHFYFLLTTVEPRSTDTRVLRTVSFVPYVGHLSHEISREPSK